MSQNASHLLKSNDILGRPCAAGREASETIKCSFLQGKTTLKKLSDTLKKCDFGTTNVFLIIDGVKMKTNYAIKMKEDTKKNILVTIPGAQVKND